MTWLTIIWLRLEKKKMFNLFLNHSVRTLRSPGCFNYCQNRAARVVGVWSSYVHWVTKSVQKCFLRVLPNAQVQMEWGKERHKNEWMKQCNRLYCCGFVLSLPHTHREYKRTDYHLLVEALCKVFCKRNIQKNQGVNMDLSPKDFHRVQLFELTWTERKIWEMLKK